MNKSERYQFHDNSVYWFANGRIHREDGPAIEFFANGKWQYEWVWRDKRCSFKEFLTYLDDDELKTFLVLRYGGIESEEIQDSKGTIA